MQSDARLFAQLNACLFAQLSGMRTPVLAPFDLLVPVASLLRAHGVSCRVLTLQGCHVLMACDAGCSCGGAHAARTGAAAAK
jgi:hypothetical protein